ncbi:DUF2079 domain-containing protein [Streptomyces sp. CAU 1734]|uniref:DUF2079 domain-containing protein n=1 Tax=Streptomyces sp. CAU 1734 TaxID=3140360 RepID=UPI003260C398
MWAPFVLAGTLFAAYATVSVLRYQQLRTRSYDLGIFEQAIRGYARLGAPIVDIKGPGTHVLGDHFSPVTMLLAAPYRLFPSPVTLLVIQAALIALSVIPVARVAGQAIGLAYGLSWGIQRAVDFDFHEIAFAVPLIAFSLEAVLRRRWRRALLFAIPLVLVKEDLGVTVAAIGVVVAICARRSSRRAAVAGIWVAVLGLAATVITLTVLIPAFNTGGGYDYWDKVEGGGNPLTTGIDVKLRTLAWILVPTTGLLALRSPLLIVALPTLGWRFLSSEPHYWSTDWHYSAILMPVMALGLADAVDRSRSSPRVWLRRYADKLPACTAAAALALTTTLPIGSLTEPDSYRRSPAVAAAEQLLDRIPDGATVSANVGPISRLAGRCRVLWVHATGDVVPDWIALDVRDGWLRDSAAYVKQLHPGESFYPFGEGGGFLLFKRRG